MTSLPRCQFLALSLLWLASMSGSAAAWAAGDVVSELMVWSVVQRDGGGEALLPAQTVKPGELLQYTATYINQGKAR